MNYKIENDFLQVCVSTLGAELQSIKDMNSKEYLWQGDEKYWTQKAPILFPIAGKLKNDQYTYKGKSYKMPMHGFACKMVFQLVEKTKTKISLMLVSNEKTLESYPFDFKLTVTYELIENQISVEYKVSNIGDDTMYYTIGAHEGYCCIGDIEDYQLVFDEEMTLYTYTINQLLLQDEKHKVLDRGAILPLKEEYFKKHALVFENIKSKEVTLVHKQRGNVLKVGYEDFKHLLVWRKQGAPHVCIEPWCALTDFWNSQGNLEKKKDVLVLRAGETQCFKHSITIG